MHRPEIRAGRAAPSASCAVKLAPGAYGAAWKTDKFAGLHRKGEFGEMSEDPIEAALRTPSGQEVFPNIFPAAAGWLPT